MTEPTFNALLRRADELLEARDFHEALATLERAEGLLGVNETDETTGSGDQPGAATGAPPDQGSFEVDRRAAKALIHLNRYPDAIERLGRALTTADRLPDVDPATVAGIRGDLGGAHAATGHHDEAEQHLTEALTELRAIHGDEHAATAKVLYNRGALRQKTSRFQEAVADMERALAIRRKILPENHPEILDSLNALGWGCVLAGDYDRAEALLREALSGRIERQGELHIETAMIFQNLGTVFQMRSDYPAARKHYEKAIGIAKATVPDHTDPMNPAPPVTRTRLILERLNGLLQQPGCPSPDRGDIEDRSLELQKN